jgi:hypothetical protein
MASERILRSAKGELPSERVAQLPEPGTEDAGFLARLNEVYGEDPNPEDERLIAGMRVAFRQVLERDA